MRPCLDVAGHAGQQNAYLGAYGRRCICQVCVILDHRDWSCLGSCGRLPQFRVTLFDMTKLRKSNPVDDDYCVRSAQVFPKVSICFVQILLQDILLWPFFLRVSLPIFFA